MKKYIIYFQFFCYSLIIAQVPREITVNENKFISNIVIQEAKFIDSLKGNFKIRDYFQATDVSYPGTYKLPAKKFIYAIPPGSRPKIKIVDKQSSVIKNTIPKLNPILRKYNDSTYYYEEVPLNYVNKNKSRIIKDFEIEDYFWFRDFYCVAIKVNTHKFDPVTNSIIKLNMISIEFDFPSDIQIKLDSDVQIRSKFDYSLKDIFYNHSIAEQFRSVEPNSLLSDTTDQWINYSADYLKISVARDGIFRIDKNLFNSLGVNISGVIPNSFQLFESGVEQKIFVAGEDDGIFDDDDYIEFWGHRNYSKESNRIINNDDQNYNEYLNRYTDTTYYFLTWNLQPGQRVFSQNIFNGNLPDSTDYYSEFMHTETNSWYQNLNNDEVANQMPDWEKNKTWYWNWLGTWNTPRTFNFDAEDVYPNKQAEIFFKLVSGGSNIAQNAHQLTLKLNDVQLDSQNVNRFDQVLLSGFPNSNLLNAGSNIITLNLYDNGTIPNFLAYDWFEVEYPRYLALQNDSINFKIANDDLPGEKIITVGNATNTSYEIFKIFPKIKKIENYIVQSNTLFFSDTVSGGDKYSIFSEDRLLSPAYIKTKNFINIRDPENQADYIAVTHPKFEEVSNEYLAYISNEYSVSTKLINVNDIYDEFGYGYPTPEAIREFFKASFQYWAEPKPSFAELIGDATYDYKYYVLQNVGVSLSTNFVPSFGNPVGDNKYTVWDESGPPIPQIKLGRLPIEEPEELEYYKSKLINNNDESFNDWNKSYLFFSGGNGNNPSEINLLKSTNDTLINKYIKPKPISGNYHHFYKTSDPPTDFGPYTSEEIQNAISLGGVFISYLGHSGTATWDNTINSVSQLENDVNRNPFITDFGCSTNKFAEPDIICFGERFLFDSRGQAIGYLGNSSLGFLSTSVGTPKYFYESIVRDSLHEIGSAHLSAKMNMFNNMGSGGTMNVFALTNTLLGDPTVRLKIPNKVNVLINQSGFYFEGTLDEGEDSSEVFFIINNFGIATDDSLEIGITQIYQGEEIKSSMLTIPLPEYRDTINYFIKTKNYPGTHNIFVELDPNNKIDEIYETDNSYNFEFDVFTLAIRDFLPNFVENGATNHITLLSPSTNENENFSIYLQLSPNSDFSNAEGNSFMSGNFYTNYGFDDLQTGVRYWLRYKLNTAGQDYSQPKSFLNTSDYNFLLSDSISFSNQQLNRIEVSENKLKLSRKDVNISVLSAGWYAGATCVIAKDGINLLSNSFFAGMGIAVFEPVTMEVDTSFWLTLFGQPGNVQALADFINTIPDGKIVAMGVSDDARNNMSNDLRNAIKTIGSDKIDSLEFRGSWAIIGWKGAPQGSVLEEVRGPYDGAIFIDTNYTIQNSTGSFVTNRIGPAAKWDSVYSHFSLPSGSSINYKLFGIKRNMELDTLGSLQLGPNAIAFDTLNADKYPYIQVEGDFEAGDSLSTPTINSLAVNFILPPELGTNYQVVSTSSDSIDQGDPIGLNFQIFNIGETEADSFSVKTTLIKSDNSERLLLDTLIAYLGILDTSSISLNYLSNFDDGYSDMSFRIEIDPDERFVEMFKDNNVFLKDFYVIKDTVTDVNSAKLSVTFNDNTIFDGDFVPFNPNIEILLEYYKLFSFNDTSSLSILLDDKPVYYNMLDSLDYDTVNRRIYFSYKTVLTDGEHLLKINGDKIIGNLEGQYGYRIAFNVSTKPELLNVYNYPNPVRNDTYFTFHLTNLPEKLDIKIFTVAGRMIRWFELFPNNLSLNLNKIYWDGRDEDGDPVASGTYFYKIILKSQSGSSSTIQKMSIVR